MTASCNYHEVQERCDMCFGWFGNTVCHFFSQLLLAFLGVDETRRAVYGLFKLRLDLSWHLQESVMQICSESVSHGVLRVGLRIHSSHLVHDRTDERLRHGEDMLNPHVNVEVLRHKP